MRSKAVLAVTAGLMVLGMGLPSTGARPIARDRDAKRDAIGIALDHVARNRKASHLTAGDLSDVAVTDSYRSEHNGVTHVYLRQRHSGLEVLGANMTVNIDRTGAVIYAPSRFISNIAAKTSGAATRTAHQAVRDAAAHLGLSAGRVEVARSSTAVDRATLLKAPDLSLSPVPATLVYQPTRAGDIRLAWNMTIEELSEQHWWNVSIDASTGELLARYDLIDHDNVEQTRNAVSHRASQKTAAVGPSPEVPADDGSSYRVYALPYESPQDGDRTLVSTPADSTSAPFGWHDTNGQPGAEFTTTRGNSVHTYADYTPAANTALPTMDAQGGAGLDFDFPLDFALPPHAWRDAAVTNLFYWNNIAHDVFYRYGFNEASGNFQVTNFNTGLGMGNDPVQAEAHDGSGVDNANFATPADGSKPRMQMYLWPDTKPGQIIDGDLDSGVILHEWGHGVSNRLTGGPNTTGCLSHQEREGEGWSDFLALATTTLPGEKGTDARGMGTYVLGQGQRSGAGIRPKPYSTDLKINNAMYRTIRTAAVPHGVGYVWATMLWEVYWNLIEEYGFNEDVYGDWTTGGNNLTLQLVMDGMKMQPCSPGFVDARDAILAADVALTEGDNQCLIWKAFAKRGLGVDATQGDTNNRTDGLESFDVPLECTLVP